jgi:hypothetical protein
MVSKDSASKKPRHTDARHGGRVVLSLDVEPKTRDALRDRAAAAGVSMAEYLANALARPERQYVTAAVEIAQPLTHVSYRLAQIELAVRDFDTATALDEIGAVKRVIAEALAPLQRQHVDEVRRTDRRRGGGWTG